MIQRYVDTASTAGGDGTTQLLTGATRAFASLREAVDSLPATLTDQTTIDCAASTGVADNSDLGQTPWDFQTSATNYLLIQAASGQRATLTQYHTDRYRLERTNPTTGAIYMNEASHVRIDGIQVKVTATTGSTIGVKLMNANQEQSDIDLRFTNGRVLGVETGGSIIGLHSRDNTGGGGMAYFWNNVVTGCNQGAEADSPNVSFFNNTFYGNNFNLIADAAFIAINNICAAGISGDFVGTFHASSSNNASSDASAPGSNSRPDQVFGFVNPGGGDFHLLSTDGGAKNFGLSDPSSGLFSDDMDRVTRTGSWDIGADELAAPTVALTGTMTSGATEADIVAGGETIILTVTGDTVVPAVQIPTVGHIVSALGATNSTTSFAITLPATLAGDLLLLEFTHRGTGDGTLGGTTSLTFAKKFEQSYNGATFSGLVYWARATGNHAGETVSVSSLTNSSAGILTVYRNVLASGDPFDGAATAVGEENASGNETQAEITTLVDGCMVILTVFNSPDVAVSSQTATNPATLQERAERLSTGGLDTSVSHASELRTAAGATGAFNWAQANGASGSLAYALQPAVLTPFADARAAMRDGGDSAQSEGGGWDAKVKPNIPLANIVRTSDTVVTITLQAQADYDITAQETITWTIPATMLSSAQSAVATPTFTIDPAGGGGAVTGATIASGAALFAGTVAHALTGATIAAASAVFAGTVALVIAGATIASTATLTSGALAQTLTGTTIASTTTLTAGSLALVVTGGTVASTATLAPGTVDQNALIQGATIASTLTLAAGTVTLDVTGATVASTAALHPGSVAVVVTGATIAATSATSAGTVDQLQTVFGVAISSTAALFGGTVTLNISGAAIASTVTLSAGSVALAVAGATIGSTAVLSTGTVALIVNGPTIAATSSTFPGTVAVVVTGATLAAGSQVFAGSVTDPSMLSGATITSTADIYPGAVELTMTGAFLASTIVMFGGTLVVIPAWIYGDRVVLVGLTFTASNLVNVGAVVAGLNAVSLADAEAE